MRRKELSPKGIRLVTSAATNRRLMGRGSCAQPMEATAVCRKEAGRRKNAELAGGWRSGRGWLGQVAAATKTSAGNRVDQDDPITSDQIKPNPTKKNGPARIKARAVGSKMARTDLDLGRARCLRGNAEPVNGKANGLSDRNTFFIYDTDEHGSGLAENVRLCSLIPAYLRLLGKKQLRGKVTPP